MTSVRQPRPFALIGTGAISQVVHVPMLGERTDVVLAAVADIDLHKAETVSERFGVPMVMEPDEALEEPTIEAVVIATPNHLHEEMAIEALERGKHVFVERPLALTAQGAARVVAAAEASGTTLMVSLPHRYRPDLVALKSFVEEGQLGNLYAVRSTWLTRHAPPLRPGWKQQREESGGGALVHLGVPAIDVCMWMLDYPALRTVRAVLTTSDFEVEDAATLIAETEDGVVVSVEVSNRHFASEDRFFTRVMGHDGSGLLPPLEIYRRLGGRPLDVTPRQPKPRGGENPYMNAYRRQIDHFVRCVNGAAEATLPSEQVALMALIEGAYRSAEAGREVTP